MVKASGKRLMEYVSSYVVFDLETTGVSTATDAVVEISAVKVKNGWVVDEFTTLVNPGRPIPYGASEINGITDDMVKDSPDFKTALRDFLTFVGDSVLVGHNIHSFDMKFIRRDAQSYWGETIANDYVDTLSLALRYLPDLPCRKLGYLAEYYGIDSEGAHRALADCRMNQKIYECLGKEMEKGLPANVKICPRCGQALSRRSGRYGEFYGCTGYPDCRYTENI